MRSPRRDGDVCYYAKVRILKQITTGKQRLRNCIGCLLLCKGKNFKANHNRIACIRLLFSDVCYYAKVRILKQITTVTRYKHRQIKMFVIMQR